MKFFVGLGNPGNRYQHTRHNVGFMVLDKLANDPWKDEKALQAQTSKTGESLLIKPQTYMNASGDAVVKALKKYEYAALGDKDFSALFVIYDDLDIPIGKYKLVFGSGPKIHNGVNSVVQSLGTDQFWHVRVGIDGRNGDRSQPSDAYVLSGIVDAEKELFTKTLDGVASLLSQHLS
jgi:PTH1 family peptidyl-tRNA hydrolase